MNINDLKYLVAVADHRHFGRAANAACVSQPTLSGQIKKLEDRLGVIIFERSTRGVKITPAGELIVNKARLVMEQVTGIETIASAQNGVMSGPLSLGLIPTIAPYLLPHFLNQTLAAYPDLTLSIHEDFTDNLLGMLEDFKIDAAILATETSQDQFEEIPLYEEEFYLVCQKGHALSAKKTVAMTTIAPADLLLLSEGHCLRDQTLELCQLSETNSGSPVDLRAASLQTLVELVRAGRGYTLVPKLAALPMSERSERLHLVQITPRPSRQIRLVCRKSFSRKTTLAALADRLKQSQSLHTALNASLTFE
ncbi:MAG: LysR substrate-binding domain-containing protein [Alphaproteobacteria bacterium]